MVLILKALLIIIAAISKAFVDTIAFHRGGKLKGDFFNINKQGKMLPFTSYPFDGFHLFNSLMIVCFIAAGSLQGFRWYVDIPVLGIIFISVFNLFFNKILKQKD